MHSHLHAQQVAQAHLSDVVADELVVLQVGTVDTGSAWVLRRIRLARGQSRFSRCFPWPLTIFVPVKEG
jgi:hypothetical protein